MKTLKLLLFALVAFFTCTVAQATVLYDATTSDSTSGTLTYVIPDPENFLTDQFYYTSWSFTGYYDDSNSDSYYAYTVWGPSGSVSIEYDDWAQISYYGEGFWPSFTQPFWEAIFPW